MVIAPCFLSGVRVTAANINRVPITLVNEGINVLDRCVPGHKEAVELSVCDPTRKKGFLVGYETPQDRVWPCCYWTD